MYPKHDYFGGFGRRLIAFLIDIAILVLLTGIIHRIGISVFGKLFEEELLRMAGMVSSLVFCLLFSVYFILFHGAVGQTPGKMVVGLKLLQESGAPVSYGTAFLRWVGYLISAFFLFLGFFWIIIDDRKQGWHDKIAKTKVHKVERLDHFHFNRYDERISSM